MYNVCVRFHQPVSGNWFLHDSDAYEKLCKEMWTVLLKPTGFMHCFNSIFSNPIDHFSSISIFLTHFWHRFIPSQPFLTNIFQYFPASQSKWWNGDAKAKGLYNEFNIESIPLLVMLLAFRFSLKQVDLFLHLSTPLRLFLLANLHLLNQHLLNPLPVVFWNAHQY